MSDPTAAMGTPPAVQTTGSGTVTVPASPPAPPPTPTPEERKYTQADVDKLIDQRMAKERDARDRESAREREAADEARKRQQGEWQSLAEGHQTRVRELEAIVTQYEAQMDEYGKTLREQNRRQLANWPEEARHAVPHGEDDDPRETAEWIKRIAPMVDKLPRTAPGVGTRAPGAAPAPPPVSGVPETSAVEAEKARLRSKGLYAP